MKTVKNKSARVLLVASTFVLLSAVGLLWITMVREAERKDLLLEYEAFRASSAVVDEYRQDRSFTPEGDELILGFGFYRIDGSSFMRYGSAPETVLLRDLLAARNRDNRGGDLPGGVSVTFSADKKSLRLLRYSGLQASSRMMGLGGGSGMGMGRGRQNQPPAAPETPPPPAQSAPQTQDGLQDRVAPSAPPAQITQPAQNGLAGAYLIWMEYSVSGLNRERVQFFLVAALITIALLGLYIVLFFVFRHNEELMSREAETRELVQLGEAARTLVHEIKNPLGIMRIQTSRIRRAASRPDEGSDSDPTQRASQLTQSADIIEGEILRLSGLADRIREFLKSRPARLAPIDLIPFLRTYCGRYRDLADSDIELVPEIPAEGSAMVLADAEKLITALDNILRNAIEAVEALPIGHRRIVVSLFRRENSWVIAVVDSGEGVSPEARTRMFDPFFTTKEKGSGIGLALSKRFVESFGGSLAYEGGDQGGGAVFTIALKEERTSTQA
ncbi:MAG TPA: HAMP domain-containing sensor histidine kinase [Rectinemataceae bacterium]|nr:HAMP domain-containing sensor histidine kinase [Rectinemataceae bacterium]